MTQTTEIIRQQKLYAKSLMLTLSATLPTGYRVALLGGAPRNWEYGMPCNDLDFYVVQVGRTPVSLEAVYGLVRDKIVSMEGSPELITPEQRENNPGYDENFLNYVMDAQLADAVCPVQIMFANPEFVQAFGDILRTFDLSNCMIGITDEFQTMMTKEFVVGRAVDKVFIIKDLNQPNASRKHLDKVMGYFPDLEFIEYRGPSEDARFWREITGVAYLLAKLLPSEEIKRCLGIARANVVNGSTRHLVPQSTYSNLIAKEFLDD